MAERETLASALAEFKRSCVPADAGIDQRIETERAFMAGAVVMYAPVMAATRHDDDDEGGRELEALHLELKEYERHLDIAAAAEQAAKSRTWKGRN